MAGAVRTPIGPDARLPTRRTLDERLFARWPGAWAALARVGFLLPPRSRLRRALLRRAVLSGWAALARGDLDLILVRWTPDCQLELLPELRAAGMRSSYHGHTGVRELMADWADAWERIDLIPQEILDAGNPVIGLGHFRLRARGSGIEFDSPIAFVWWFNRGLIARQQDFADWDEALRAAGIDPAALGEAGSAAMAGAVRTPIGPDAGLPKRRTLQERLFVRWPGIYAALSRAVLRLPPRSRLRRALLRRALLSGWASWARGDLDLNLVPFAPDCHMDPLPELLAVGMSSSYEGHAERRELVADVREAWERMDLVPQEIVDAGNPFVFLGHLHLRARGSGIEFDTPFGQVLWIERGLIVRESDFVDWDEALRVAGIPAIAVGEPQRATPI